MKYYKYWREAEAIEPLLREYGWHASFSEDNLLNLETWHDAQLPSSLKKAFLHRNDTGRRFFQGANAQRVVSSQAGQKDDFSGAFPTGFASRHSPTHGIFTVRARTPRIRFVGSTGKTWIGNLNYIRSWIIGTANRESCRTCREWSVLNGFRLAAGQQTKYA